MSEEQPIFKQYTVEELTNELQLTAAELEQELSDLEDQIAELQDIYKSKYANLNFIKGYLKDE